jgi:hypothetical protein
MLRCCDVVEEEEVLEEREESRVFYSQFGSRESVTFHSAQSFTHANMKHVFILQYRMTIRSHDSSVA